MSNPIPASKAYERLDQIAKDLEGTEEPDGKLILMTIFAMQGVLVGESATAMLWNEYVVAFCQKQVTKLKQM